MFGFENMDDEFHNIIGTQEKPWSFFIFRRLLGA